MKWDCTLIFFQYYNLRHWKIVTSLDKSVVTENSYALSTKKHYASKGRTFEQTEPHQHATL